MHPGRALLASMLAVLTLSPAAVAGPVEDAVQEVACRVSLDAVLPCETAGRPDWWEEDPEAGWGESPSVSILSADGTRFYTGAVVYGHNDGGDACRVRTRDVASGRLLWSTDIPDLLGCGLVLDLVEEPGSGDILLAGYDFFDSDVGALHRLDGDTGLPVWHSIPSMDAIAGFTIDGTHVVATGRTADRAGGWIGIYDLATGQATSSTRLVTTGGAPYFPFDLDGTAGDRYIAGGVVIEQDPSYPYDPYRKTWTRAVAKLGTDGTVDWLARDPTQGAYGRHMVYAEAQGRAFMSGQHGILTVDTTTGTVLGVSGLERGETWDDVIAHYAIAYDPVQDIAVMLGSRDSAALPAVLPAALPAVLPAALAAVAVRGTTGALLWDRDVAATEQYAIPGDVAFASDGSVWSTASTMARIDGDRRFTGHIGRIDPVTGDVLQRATPTRLPGDDMLLGDLALLPEAAAVVSGDVRRLDGVRAGVEFRWTFGAP